MAKNTQTQGLFPTCYDAPKTYSYHVPDALETLSPDDVYVVGGFVDRSVRKGETLRRAEAAGVRAVRLPVAEHAARSDLHPILSINAVVQILGDATTSFGLGGQGLDRMSPVGFFTRQKQVMTHTSYLDF